MKIEDIKMAYDSVSSTAELKEKVFSRLDTETEDFSQTGASHIKLKKGGGSKFTAASFAVAAAVITLVLVINKTVFDADIAKLPAVTETAFNAAEIPENTALVTLRLVDENGVPVKNMRVDYLPVVIKQEDSAWEGWSGALYTFDIENFDKGGTIPMTYGRDEKLLIPYGDYRFAVSNAMPNAEYNMPVIEQTNILSFMDGSGAGSQLVTVDENTEEIVLTEWGGNDPYKNSYPKLGVILQDANGAPLPGYTVILKPADGVMQEGYSDIYGGYVLTVTDENGEAFWRNIPISGEYEVIAYREELHTADEPVVEPFVFDGDNTFIYVYTDAVLIYEKIFKMAE